MEREIYIDNKPVKINIKDKLNYLESIGFVSAIVYSLIDEDSMTVSYALKEYEIRLKTIEFFTDYKMPEISDKDSENDTKLEKYLNKCYSIVFDTDIYDEIKKVVDLDLYNELLEAVDNQLNFEIQKMQNSLKAQTEEMISQFTQLSEALRVFEGIDINGLAKVLPQSIEKFDPNSEEFIKAVLANSNQKKQTNKKTNKDSKDGSVVQLKGQIKMPIDDKGDDK